MKSVFSLSIDSRKAQWLEEEANRLSLSRSQIAQEVLDAGVQYLNRRDSVGYAEIDFLEASEDEIIRLIKRSAIVLKERRRKKADDLCTSTNKIQKDS